MDIEPRKQARQTRAKATEAAIVEAAARILEEEPAGSLTTNNIAARAGVSIGSLYQYFPNREAIVVALVRRERSSLLANMRQIAGSAEAGADALDRLIAAALAHQFARPRLALRLEYLEQTMDIGPETQELADQLAGAIATIVESYAPHADPRAAQDVVAMCRAIINTAALAGETDIESIRRRLRSAVRGYLG